LSSAPILFVYFLSPNAIGLGLCVSARYGLLLTERLRPEGVRHRAVCLALRVIAEQGGPDNARFDAKPNSTRGNAHDQTADNGP
jgi:hypothetical protein